MIRIWGDADPQALSKIKARAQIGLGNVPIQHIDPMEYPDLILPNVGDVIIVVGKWAIGTLIKAGILPKGRSVTSMREKAYPHEVKNAAGEVLGVGYWMVSYSPSILFSDPTKAGELVWDIKLAHRLYSSGSCLLYTSPSPRD